MKALGLILTDGNLSALLKGYRTIVFRGVNESSVQSISKTFLQLGSCIRIRNYSPNVEKFGVPSFQVSVLSKGSFRPLKEELIKLLKSVFESPLSLFSRLSTRASAAFLAGILDGDGYVGKEKRYISIALKRSSNKGRIIHEFLRYVEAVGLISVGKYTGPPKYEVVITFPSIDYARLVSEYVYHPLKRERFLRYLRNVERSRYCGTSIEQYKAILIHASYGYLMKKGNSAILVLYIPVRQAKKGLRSITSGGILPKPLVAGGRLMIKVPKKCIPNLAKALEQSDTNRVNEKIAEVVKTYIKDYGMSP